jgi:hypothetical protein
VLGECSEADFEITWWKGTLSNWDTAAGAWFLEEELMLALELPTSEQRPNDRCWTSPI